MKTPLNLDNYRLFSALGLFLLGLDFWAILLSLSGLFYFQLILLYLLIGGFFILRLILKNNEVIRLNRTSFFTILLSCLAIVFFFASATPTIFSGRDQGSFSEAAIRLVQNHNLKSSSVASQEFFKIHGEGLAQNFPGFNYDKNGNLVPHFSLGYISWLASFYSLFGLMGLIAANSIAFLLFIWSFFILIRIFSNKSAPAVVSVIFILSSFAFSWLTKFTLSENLALGFLWFALAQLAIFTKTENRTNLLLSLVSLLILAFSRLEIWSFIFMLGLWIFFKYRKEKINLLKIFDRKIIFIASIIFFFYLLNVLINSPFYIASLKGLLKSFSSENSDSSFFSGLGYVLGVLSAYALISPLLISLIGIFHFIKKKNFRPLLPLLVILPSFIYLIHPGISPDHPWMLRRFIFSVIPASIFISFTFLYDFFGKKIYFYLLSSIMIISNLLVLSPYINYSENKNLLSETEKLSRNFSSSDLILVDRLSSGNGWAMITGPMNFLFNKQAVYFFDPKDLEKIDKKKFSNIYLVIPDNNLDFYARQNIINRLEVVKDYSIKTSSLETKSSAPASLPQKSEQTVFGKIYLLKK